MPSQAVRTSLVVVLLAAALISAACPEPALARGPTAEIGADGLPNVKSDSALVIDLGNDRVLYEKDADRVRPIASISKIFGALVLTEECKLDPEALHEMSVANRLAARGGDKTKLNTGWSYTHRDLLHAALMRSDNRALPALAEACGLDPAAFAAKMTAKARSLGLTKTNFKEPDGLSAENVSTAREVMVALRSAIKVPELAEIMGKAEYTLTAHKDSRTREIKIHNTDRLLTRNIAQILGGKTGYTDLARYCLAVAARMTEGREVGMVFLGAEGRLTRFADFTRVVHWLAAGNASAPLVAGAPSIASDASAAAQGAVAVPVVAAKAGAGVGTGSLAPSEAVGVVAGALPSAPGAGGKSPAGTASAAPFMAPPPDPAAASNRAGSAMRADGAGGRLPEPGATGVGRPAPAALLPSGGGTGAAASGAAAAGTGAVTGGSGESW